MRKYNKNECKNFSQFILLQHFWAGHPTELRQVINLQNMVQLKLNATVKLATIEARKREESHFTKVYEITLDPQPLPIEHSQVDAIQQAPRQQQKKFNYQTKPTGFIHQNTNQLGNQNFYKGPGNNFECNKQMCVFCQLQGH
jgi:hypothetical protein